MSEPKISIRIAKLLDGSAEGRLGVVAFVVIVLAVIIVSAVT
ncbi:hypothetical protein [Mesorhizobium tianshanense]|uniref:Uncharacterized protein n=1 Tax=Mesorhizobium tianshanense TaxID=39844 RepID=A0A562N4A2_9HYPH|nr:hypothetical protein [Mesorhizobium tianshanense]TWI26974.1 hypothetical protein IQ26_05670 [Mesorhizobium tianshanense]